MTSTAPLTSTDHGIQAGLQLRGDVRSSVALGLSAVASLATSVRSAANPIRSEHRLLHRHRHGVDGQGFDKAEDFGGVGLVSVRKRLELLGGTIGSAPGAAASITDGPRRSTASSKHT